MSPTTTLPRQSGGLSLHRPLLPRWAPWAVAGLAVAFASAVTLATGMSWGGFGLIAAVGFVAGQGVLSARVEGRRRATDRTMGALVYASFALALIPLAAVLSTTVAEGVERLDSYFLTHSMRNVGPRDDAGGAYHAIIGTIEQVGLASLMAVPVGLLTAVYLVEYGRGRLAAWVRFFIDVMTGVPSIVAGLFIFSLWILVLGQGFSGFAGAMALAILMLPVVARSSEEMLKLVPRELREASLALGVPQWRTILHVVVPTALPGIITGVMLAVARVVGETAPLLLTTFFTDSINNNPFDGPQVALPQYVYNEANRGLDLATQRAWAGALTLILIVMTLNLLARLVARSMSARTGR